MTRPPPNGCPNAGLDALAALIDEADEPPAHQEAAGGERVHCAARRKRSLGEAQVTMALMSCDDGQPFGNRSDTSTRERGADLESPDADVGDRPTRRRRTEDGRREGEERKERSSCGMSTD